MAFLAACAAVLIVLSALLVIGASLVRKKIAMIESYLDVWDGEFRATLREARRAESAVHAATVGIEGWLVTSPWESALFRDADRLNPGMDISVNGGTGSGRPEDMVELVRRSKSPDPQVAAEAKRKLESMSAQFTQSKRSGVETR